MGDCSGCYSLLGDCALSRGGCYAHGCARQLVPLLSNFSLAELCLNFSLAVLCLNLSLAVLCGDLDPTMPDLDPSILDPILIIMDLDLNILDLDLYLARHVAEAEGTKSGTMGIT